MHAYKCNLPFHLTNVDIAYKPTIMRVWLLLPLFLRSLYFLETLNVKTQLLSRLKCKSKGGARWGVLGNGEWEQMKFGAWCALYCGCDPTFEYWVIPLPNWSMKPIAHFFHVQSSLSYQPSAKLGLHHTWIILWYHILVLFIICRCSSSESINIELCHGNFGDSWMTSHYYILSFF